MIRCLRPRWILDGLGQAFENHGLVLEQDHIVAITPGKNEGDTDLDDALIIPGLVNPHVHLDLSFCPRNPPSSFASWVRQIIAHRQTLSPQTTLEAIEAGVRESLSHGVTMVGDISTGGQSWEVLARNGLRGTVYFECLGLTPGRVDSSLNQWEEWLIRHEPANGLQPGMSPHAPYSTARRIYQYAGLCGLPIATHIAESAEEIEFLENGKGPLCQLLVDLGIDPAWVDIKGISDVWDFLRGSRFLALVHGNHRNAEAVLSPGPGQGWIHCPRTHHFFGHKAHPFESPWFDPQHWSLGTDGLSSNPDLNLLEEARMVHGRFPKIDPWRLLAMITIQPAKIMGWGHRGGSIEPGKWADFAVFRPGNRGKSILEPHLSLLEEPWHLEEIWIGGELKMLVG